MVFAIYSHGGHLGHVTLTIFIKYCSSIPRTLILNLALIGQVVTEKNKFHL